MSYTDFRIFNVNYIDDEILADYEASSADTQFPLANIFNQNRRSKVWRSAGYWNITISNNRLVFRETTGVDLTAVLNTGLYTSDTEFLAEIERAMEAVGGSDYDVERQNLKIRIISDQAGGGGIFELYTSGSTLANEIGLTANKTGDNNYYMDNIMIHGTSGEYIEWDMGVPTNPDAFIAIDQKDASLKISPSATIKLQANETGNWSSPSYEQSLTYDDEVLSLFDDSGLADQPYRYWRLYFYDAINPNGYIQLGAVFLGNYMSWARGRANFPLKQGYIDRSVNVFSEGGQSFADIKSKTQKFSVSINALQKADIEEMDVFFNDFGTGKPFFVSMDTGQVFSSNVNRRVMLCKFDRAPSYDFLSPDFFIANITLREEL